MSAEEQDQPFTRPPPSSEVEIGHGGMLRTLGSDSPIKRILDYMLQLEIPEEYKEEFEAYKPILSRVLALAYIRREDIPRYLDYFDAIALWYKINSPHVARKRMMRMATELLLTRGVDGFEHTMFVTSRFEQLWQGYGTKGGEKEKKGHGVFRG